MENVGCGGSMTSLADCYHNGWGRHNCDHNEDVSIKCAVPTTTEIGRCTLRVSQVDCILVAAKGRDQGVSGFPNVRDGVKLYL